MTIGWFNQPIFLSNHTKRLYKTCDWTNKKARYCGSPIHYNKKEINFNKKCFIVEVKANEECNIDEVNLRVYKPIEIWKCSSIEEAILKALEQTPPELAGDIYRRGLYLTGGGALLSNLDVLLRERTGLPVSISEDPLTCVVMGSGKVLEEIKLLRQLTTD